MIGNTNSQVMKDWQTVHPSSWDEYDSILASNPICFVRIAQYNWPSQAYCNMTYMYIAGDTSSVDGVFRIGGSTGNGIAWPIYVAGRNLHCAIPNTTSESIFALNTYISLSAVTIIIPPHTGGELTLDTYTSLTEVCA